MKEVMIQSLKMYRFQSTPAGSLVLWEETERERQRFFSYSWENNEYQGAITRSVVFDYFPYPVKQKDLERTAAELMEDWKAGVESWRVLCELEKLDMDAELLYRPFGTLSFGERTRVMLAVLFSGENDFLLIDEPTNHLDQTPERLSKISGVKKRIYSGIPRQGSAGCLHRSCAGFKPGLDRSTERQFFQLVGKQGKSRSFCQNGT